MKAEELAKKAEVLLQNKKEAELKQFIKDLFVTITGEMVIANEKLSSIEKKEYPTKIDVNNLAEVKTYKEVDVNEVKKPVKIDSEWFSVYDDTNLLEILKRIEEKRVELNIEKFDATDVVKELKAIREKNVVAISPTVVDGLVKIEKELRQLNKDNPSHTQIDTFIAKFEEKIDELIEKTGNIEIDADTINLNTDEIESKLDDVVEAIDNIEVNIDTTLLAKESKQDDIITAIGEIDLDTTGLATEDTLKKLVGFDINSDIDISIVTDGDIKTITETDGTKTRTTIIDKTDPDNKLISTVWT